VRYPSVLLLDEPLSHLDAAERDATRRELKRLQRETRYTTVLVTHDQHEALSLADRIAVMNDGALQQVGTADEVYDRPANLFVADFVGEPRMNLLNGQLRDLGDNTIEVRLSEDARVVLPGRLNRSGAERQVTLGTRPQDIGLERLEAEGVLPATVFAFEPLQEVGRLTLELPGVGQRVVVETHHDLRAVPGEVVGLRLDPARTHLFDTETGDRLEWETAPRMAAR
jgi:multiple sugar transport system ATP-binding protein